MQNMKEQKLNLQKIDIIILFIFTLIMIIISFKQDETLTDKQEEVSSQISVTTQTIHQSN